jgi:hypothetical protein
MKRPLHVSAVASNFARFDLSSVTSQFTFVTFIKNILNSLDDMVAVLLEKDLGKQNSIKILVSLVVIYLGNEYRNQLTIELVYPRAQDAIRNVTELLDLNFNIIYIGGSNLKVINKSNIIKSLNIHWEIDADKRVKYVREVDRWFILTVNADELFRSKIKNPTERNAILMSVPDHIQMIVLKGLSISYYPISCHFVKQPFAPKFKYLYFYNSKAEEFKWLTAKFLDHGLFEFWKGLHSQLWTLNERGKENLFKRSNNSSSTESPDFTNFIGQVHLPVIYFLVSILTGICIVVFLPECAIQTAQNLSLLAFKKIKQFGMNLVWTVVRCLFLAARLVISRISRNS